MISPVGYPPPFAGNRARNKELIRMLRELGLAVHFCGAALAPAEAEATRREVDVWVGNLLPFEPPAPLLRRLGRRVQREVADRVLGAARPPDTWVHHRWLAEVQALQARARYARVIVSYVMLSKLLRAFPDALKLIDTHDVFAGRNERLAASGVTEGWISMTAEEEARGLRRADRIIAIQEQEAEYFRALPGVGPVVTVGYNITERAALRPPPGTGVVGFIGSTNAPNRHAVAWLLDAVWPAVVAERPEARLLMAGGICAVVGDHPNVEKAGLVDDVGEFYARCDFLVNPMQVGTGLKVKTAEALGYGRCVVSTPVGAEGLEEFIGRGIEVCGDGAEFAREMVRYLRSPGDFTRQYAMVQALVGAMRQANRENLAAALEVSDGAPKYRPTSSREFANVTAGT